jgi:hypothetical protein
MSRGTTRKKSSSRWRSAELAAAEEFVRRASTLAELDWRLSHLTWWEIGLAEERPTAIAAGRRRNRYATLAPEISATRKTLSRLTRVRAVTYLLREVRDLRAKLIAEGQLTMTELTRAGRAFGPQPEALRKHLEASADRADQAWSALHDALATEEAVLVETLKTVKRVPDPVLPLRPDQLRWLTVRQLLRLLAAAQYEFREHMLVLRLAAHFYETNPPGG